MSGDLGSLGSLVVSLTGETAQFKDAFTKAAYQLDQNVGQMVGSMKALQTSIAQVDATVGAFGINLRNMLGLASAGAFAGLISGAIESAAHVQHLSEQTGIAADQLAAMKAAATAGGASLDDVARASAKFSKAIETQNEDSGAAAQALSAMGLSMEEVKTHSPAEQLHIVAERLNTFADGSGKAAAAQVLFGRSGMEILPFLKFYGEQVNLTKDGYAEYARQAQEFEISLGKLKAGSQAIVNHWAQELLPSLQAVVNGFLAMNTGASDGFSVMGTLGELIRTLALGFATASLAIKGVAADIAGSFHVAVAMSTGDVNGAIAAQRAWDATIGDNEAAYAKFVGEVTKGSKWFGDAAMAMTNLGAANAETKRQIDLNNAAIAAQNKAATELEGVLQKLSGVDIAYATNVQILAKAFFDGRLKADDYQKALRQAYEQSKAGVQAHNDAATAAKAQEAALDKLVTTEQTFHDSLQREIDLVGATREEILKYDARTKGLGDSQDDLIHKNVTLLQQEADARTAFSYAGTEAKNYADYLNTASSRNQDIINSWQTGNQKLADQITALGLTKTAVELLQTAAQAESDAAVINAQADSTARDNQYNAFKQAYDDRIRLINAGAEKEAMLAQIDAETKAMKAAADATQKVYDDTAKSINKSIVDSLYDGLVKKGTSFGETLKSALESMFKNLILKPLLQPVSNALAGVYQEGTSYASGLFGVGGMFSTAGNTYGNDPNSAAAQFGGYGGAASAAGGSWAGALGGAALGGSITSQYGSHSAIPGVIAGGIIGYAGSAAIVAGGAALAAGAGAAAAATTAFAAAAAAVPVIGWIVAAIAIIASFMISPGGGPKTGGSSWVDYSESGAMTHSANRFYTPNDRDSAVDQFTQGIAAKYYGTIAALGGKAGQVSFGMGYDMDQAGTAQNRLSTYVGVGRQQVYGFQDLQLGRDSAVLQARMSVEASRMLLAAVQASQLPEDVAKLLNGLMPAALGSDQISNVLAYAAAFHSLPQQIKDGLAGVTGLEINPETSVELTKFGAAFAAVQALVNADPTKDTQTLVDAANQTALDKFHAQGTALSALASQFDGSATAALNLAQATATYYQNMVQLLVALEQASAAFHNSIQDAKRTISLDVAGTYGHAEQMAWYRNELASQQEIIRQAWANPATADPNSVAKAGDLSRADLLALWNLQSDEEKKQNNNWFVQQLDTLDAQVTSANKAISDAIKAQNDPSNPNSPIAQVKGAFDGFMLDMKQWLIDNRQIATAQTDAANANTEAANTQLAAANTQLTAAQTPIQINVDQGGGGDGGAEGEAGQ